MAWRTVTISNPASLRLERDQLAVAQESVVTLPLEDIAVLILESPQVTMTSALLNRMAELDVALIVCDGRHMPSLACLPFAGNCRLSGVQRAQLDTSLPFRKRCWQAVIVRKIENQAACLQCLGRPGAEKVGAMARRVVSGDAGNVESIAAREHFHAAFGGRFRRDSEGVLNSAMDYGYAIMRGAVARGLAAHGLILSQGIAHHSELNQFNLADDFIEPFRPVVDLFVASREFGETLSKADRAELAGLLNADVLMDGQRQTVLRAAEMTAASFQAACREKSPALLRLPELVSIKNHAYE